MTTTIVRRETPQINVDFATRLNPVLRRVFANRGLCTDEETDISLACLARPDQLGGIGDAVTLIEACIREQKRILIVGDFDADGATSTALAISALRAMGAKWVHFLVPNRFRYGYGLSPELVAEAQKQTPDLIITVDNGISCHAGVEAAREAGINVIVTDHHLPGSSLPAADAIVNPNVRGDGFPSKNLAGVGVVFYLLSALRTHLRERGWFDEAGIKVPNLGNYLDLVALGTVADVVGLDQNNRILVEQGLRRIRKGQMCQGIRALLEVAGKDHALIKSSDLGFALGPRLNAAGRLDDMSEGIECLLSTEATDAKRRALQLDQLNRERREIETEMKADALAIVEQLTLDEAGLPIGLCLFEPHWHEGVVGIVASRVKEEFHRPVIAFARSDDGRLKGSARSVQGVHVRDVLERIHSLNPGMIDKFGGHAMAAGLTLPEAHLGEFELAFENVVSESLDEDGAQGVVYSDGELSADDLTLDLAQQLVYALPWGQGFPVPVFDGEFELMSRKTLGDGSHLKMMLRPIDGRMPVEAIAFHFRNEIPDQGARLRIAYELDVNHFRGESRLQCLVRHLESA